jgi:hypothetical protein
VSRCGGGRGGAAVAALEHGPARQAVLKEGSERGPENCTVTAAAETFTAAETYYYAAAEPNTVPNQGSERGQESGTVAETSWGW